jgi:hypothetical protein
MVQIALTQAGLSSGNRDDGTVLPPDDAFAATVRELTNHIVSEGVIDIVDGNPRLPGVRQSVLPDLLENFRIPEAFVG